MTVRYDGPDGMTIEGPDFLLEVNPLPNHDRPRAPEGVELSHGGDGDPAVLDVADVMALRDWLTRWLDGEA